MEAKQTIAHTDCQGASDVLIYGQLLEADNLAPSSSTSPNTLPILQLRAARILSVPREQKQPRPPRPDDPSPRFPPTQMYARKRHAEDSPSARLKRRKEDVIQQNARDVLTRIPSAGVTGNNSRPKLLPRAKTVQDDVFKVPSLPDPKGKGKALDIAKELEKANKAVSRAYFVLVAYWPNTNTSRWLSVLRATASRSTGFTRPTRNSRKYGVSYIAEPSLL